MRDRCINVIWEKYHLRFYFACQVIKRPINFYQGILLHIEREVNSSDLKNVSDRELHLEERICSQREQIFS